ncbi:hypothetical protein [Streptomyces sp. NPDC047928]|uniref:hypothetical protein n=1 Tax=unclassified Streptomyces TaxID=2593676 RepID=UPI003718CBDC
MRTERTRMAASMVPLLAVFALAGCTADGGERRADTVPPTAAGTLEELADRAECRPDIQTEAAEIRQANCATAYGTYVLTTFATDRGQREWINGAKDYGGVYLVGRKWAAVGEPEVITALRGRLGGDVETASPHHSGNSGGDGGSEEDHSGHHGS